jgi:hypothetical protein
LWDKRATRVIEARGDCQANAVHREFRVFKDPLDLWDRVDLQDPLDHVERRGCRPSHVELLRLQNKKVLV